MRSIKREIPWLRIPFLITAFIVYLVKLQNSDDMQQYSSNNQYDN